MKIISNCWGKIQGRLYIQLKEMANFTVHWIRFHRAFYWLDRAVS